METKNLQQCFGGSQGSYEHASEATQTPMRFSVFQPPQAKTSKTPVLWYLSGLTCTEENFTVKGGAQRVAAELGVTVIAPDTSPRGAGIAGEDESYDLGTGAGFYVDATQAPWNSHYKMYSYITEELPALVAENFNVDMSRQGITGHSMGGHGALTLGLRNPDQYRSISAFSPICAPSQCAWGEKALGQYLGDDQTAWQQHDATALINSGHHSAATILIDQGQGDEFLANQLHPDKFEAACKEHGQALALRYQAGYDHSYYFIASFMEDHLRHHAAILSA
ncbi:MAG: S-formylglutathione hydrolase [Saprospiraceae bacterium]|jgi:S-formylglutathione hydrolase